MGKSLVLALVMAALVVAMVLPGCNTVKGAARDVQALGEALEDAAD